MILSIGVSKKIVDTKIPLNVRLENLSDYIIRVSANEAFVENPSNHEVKQLLPQTGFREYTYYNYVGELWVISLNGDNALLVADSWPSYPAVVSTRRAEATPEPIPSITHLSQWKKGFSLDSRGESIFDLVIRNARL